MAEQLNISEIMTPEQYREVCAYERSQRRCMLLDRSVDLIFLGLMTFVVARPVTEFLAKRSSLLAEHDYLLLGVLLLGMTILHACISFPLSFYSGWIVEHRFGVSTLTVAHWFKRWMSEMGIVLLLNLALLSGLFFLIRLCGSWWWAVTACCFLAFMLLMQFLVPIVLLPLFYRLERLENESLFERFRELVRSTTLKVSGIFRMDLSVETTKANAMLCGVGATRRVLLGDTLLKDYSEDEIIAIFAHEVGHHVHGHVRRQMIGVFIISFGLFWLMDLALRLWLGSAWCGYACNAPINYADLPIWTVPFFILAMFLFGQIFEPFQNAVSRRFERQADAYAVAHCGAPSALRSAFIKLAVQNKADPFPPRWEVFWFHSHPPLGERIAAIPHQESLNSDATAVM